MAAVRKKKGSSFFRYALLISGITALLFIGYLGVLWWQSRQMQFVTYPQFGIPIPAQYEIHGIDVSRYQQRISWKAVKNMNVRGIKIGFAFIKATEGTGKVDPFFKRNWKNSREAGVPRGAYHFFIASRDPQVQASNFIKQVALQPGDLPPVLDVENTFGVAPALIRQRVKVWLNILESHYGVKPIIYTNADFYKRNLQPHFDGYPLWVAHYLQPHQPRISRNWAFWQHSEQGLVNGISGKVDFNVFKGDSAAFRSLLVP